MPAQHIRRESESQAVLLPEPLRPAAGAAPGPRISPDRRSLERALESARTPGACGLIAEIKRRSPSAGPLREDLDPVELARLYETAGAAAISVLTEPARFGGSLSDLERVAGAVRIPVLRKDFLLETRQVAESREAGADAVLLIVRLLGRERLGELAAEAAALGLETLVEVHDVEELRPAAEIGARVVGVNNRDLATLRTDVSHSLIVAREAWARGIVWPLLPVSESGIRARTEVLELARAGYRAVLVGESLLRETDPGRAVRRLLGDEP